MQGVVHVACCRRAQIGDAKESIRFSINCGEQTDFMQARASLSLRVATVVRGSRKLESAVRVIAFKRQIEKCFVRFHNSIKLALLVRACQDVKYAMTHIEGGRQRNFADFSRLAQRQLQVHAVEILPQQVRMPSVTKQRAGAGSEGFAAFLTAVALRCLGGVTVPDDGFAVAVGTATALSKTAFIERLTKTSVNVRLQKLAEDIQAVLGRQCAEAL